MSTRATTIECRDALSLFEKKRFEQWRGLPAACMEQLQRRWKIADTGTLHAPLGGSKKATAYDYYRVAGYGQLVRVWHRRGDIVQIDVEEPLSAKAAALLDALGAPEARLDADYGFARLPGGEWFFGTRGLSLLVLAEEDAVKALSVFQPTTLTQYMDRLRIERGARPLPEGAPA